MYCIVPPTVVRPALNGLHIIVYCIPAVIHNDTLIHRKNPTKSVPLINRFLRGKDTHSRSSLISHLPPSRSSSQSFPPRHPLLYHLFLHSLVLTLKMSDTSAVGLEALCGAFIGLTTITIVLRFYGRYRQKLPFLADDWLMIPAWVR